MASATVFKFLREWFAGIITTDNRENGEGTAESKREREREKEEENVICAFCVTSPCRINLSCYLIKPNPVNSKCKRGQEDGAC